MSLTCKCRFVKGELIEWILPKNSALTPIFDWVIVSSMKYKPLALFSSLLVYLLLPACSLSRDIPLVGPPPTPTTSATPDLSPTPSSTPTPLPIPTPVPAVRIDSGDQALFNGDWETALYEYQSAHTTSNDPEVQAAALLGIGRAQLMSRNYYEAQNGLERLIEEFPDSPYLAQAYFFLGQAHDAQEQYYDAADAYLNYLILRPGLIDAYVLHLRGDALFAAGDYAEAANDYKAALESPSLLDEILLRLKLARAYAISGDYPTALALYDDLYYRTSNDNTRALIDLRKGQAYTAMGQIDLANAAYLDAVTNYPTSYDSYLALVELIDAGVEVDELQRGIVDYYAGQYGVALGAFDRYLQDNPTDPGTAHYFYGLTTRALGGWQEAVSRWDKVIQNYPDHPYWDDAWEQKAYTQWSFLEQYPEAIQTLIDFVEKASGHPRAAEFLFDAALIAERAVNLNQAIELWERLASHYPNYERVPRALFLAGISHYRLGDYQAALTTFQRFQSLVSSLEDRASAHFWIGKSLEALGDSNAAREAWEIASGIDPTGYYSERSRDILYERPPFAPPLGYDIVFDEQAERARAETWLRTTFGLPEDFDLSGLGPLASEPSLRRGTELWELGVYNEARAEFEQLRQTVQLDAASTFRLASYLTELGAYRSAIMAARQVLDLALMDDAMTLSAPGFFSHLRFGTYFADLLMPLAQEYGFHPLFLFSVVRQESLFDAYVSSSADARGLMQIIPATGADINENLGWPQDYTSEDLYLPLLNLKYGTDYLDTQRESFDGNLYAALAAYNGGPGNARLWYKHAVEDPDLFLEVIRFIETRNYVRRIYEIFNIYRLIYDRTP